MGESEKIMKNVFVNLSNHKSELWSEDQKEAIREFGCDEIADVQFPMVDPEATRDEIYSLADQVVDSIVDNYGLPGAVMCQGEFTLSFAMICKLKELGIPVVAACSCRRVRSEKLASGEVKKEVLFEFKGYREY